jgi:protein subunit release factor A
MCVGCGRTLEEKVQARGGRILLMTDYKKIREEIYEKHSKSFEKLHMSEIKEQLYKDTDVRVIDQRIGMGIGGLNTVIRLYHKPTGILIEMPRLNRNQYLDKVLAFEMLEYALSGVKE